MLLPPESKDFLASQCNAYASMYVPQKHMQINSIDHTVQTLTVSANGQYTCSIQNDDFMKEFYELSSLIDSSRDIYAKLDACEKSYPNCPLSLTAAIPALKCTCVSADGKTRNGPSRSAQMQMPITLTTIMKHGHITTPTKGLLPSLFHT